MGNLHSDVGIYQQQPITSQRSSPISSRSPSKGIRCEGRYEDFARLDVLVANISATSKIWERQAGDSIKDSNRNAVDSWGLGHDRSSADGRGSPFNLAEAHESDAAFAAEDGIRSPNIIDDNFEPDLDWFVNALGTDASGSYLDVVGSWDISPSAAPFEYGQSTLRPNFH